MLTYPTSWQDRKAVIAQGVLFIPTFYEHQENNSDLLAGFIGSDLYKEVYMEICSGNGEWITEKALKNPDILWIAVEKKIDRASKILKKAPANLRIVCGDGVLFLDYYLPKSIVSHLFVNFPDPWPKARHAKHRIMNDRFIDLVFDALVPKGKFTFISDDLSYAQITQALFANHPRWKVVYQGVETSLDGYGHSYFGSLWKSKGRSFYRIEQTKADDALLF